LTYKKAQPSPPPRSVVRFERPSKLFVGDSLPFGVAPVFFGENSDPYVVGVADRDAFTAQIRGEIMTIALSTTKLTVAVSGVAAMLICAGTALAQPANDICSSGSQLVVVSANASLAVPGTNVGAATEGNACVSSSSDVWYRVVAPQTGNMTADTCAASMGDSVVSIRSACPGSGADLGCDDDSCGQLRSRVTIPVTIGTTYYLRVASYGGSGGQGAFTLTIAFAPPTPPPGPPVLGPDVIINQITDVARWGTDAAGTTTAYSVGTDSCNPGDVAVLWFDSNDYLPDYDITQHPVISQNMFRLKSYGAYSRFEQLGQSWLKHGFVSTNSGLCGTCLPSNIWFPSTQSFRNVGGDVLGINCSDTYGAGLNGSQGGLGPKNIVNATLGTSPFVRGTGTGDGVTRSRLQVPTSDVLAQPAGTKFFVDAYYVAADDSQFVRPGQTVATNALNNAAWRELTLASINGNPAFAGSTRQREPGILAWKAADPTVTVVTADHDDTPNPSTGYRDNTGQPAFPGTFIRSRYWVAAKATTLAGGLYRYEYVVYNHNSDRSSNSFSIPLPAAATLSDINFRAPKWHSGEPYANTQWTNSRAGNTLTFSTNSFVPPVPPAVDSVNALRWGNSFNFGFTTNIAPSTGSTSIGLYKPGTTSGAPVAITAGGLSVPTVVTCTAATVSPVTGTPADAVCPGTSITLIATGGGTGPLGYQWRRNTTPINMANGATFVISSAAAGSIGSYDVVVTNACGTATSPAVTVNVSLPCSIADLTHSGTCADGTVDGSDFIAFINSFGTGDVAVDPLADVAGGGNAGDLPDGIVDGSDFVAFINAFSAGC